MSTWAYLVCEKTCSVQDSNQGSSCSATFWLHPTTEQRVFFTERPKNMLKCYETRTIVQALKFNVIIHPHCTWGDQAMRIYKSTIMLTTNASLKREVYLYNTSLKKQFVNSKTFGTHFVNQLRRCSCASVICRNTYMFICSRKSCEANQTSILFPDQTQK